MKSVLLVDDSTICREPIAQAIRQFGFDVDTAANGQEALKKIEKSLPDLIILDLQMPVMDGMTMLNILRNDSQTKDVPVVMLTDAQKKSQIIQTLRLGVRSYMIKSFFSLEKLQNRINEALSIKDTPAAKQPFVEENPPTHDSAKPTSNDVGSANASPIAQLQEANDPETTSKKLKENKPFLTRSEIQEALDECGELNSLSPSVSEVLSLTGRKDCPREALVKVIKQDPGISMRLLRLANSSVYDRGEPADTIDKAVMRMGISAVRQAVLNISVVDELGSDDDSDPRLDIPQFWEHGIATGLIAAALVRGRGNDDDPTIQDAADTAFTMGLLHDAGQLVYANLFPSKYNKVLDIADDLGLPVQDVESRVLLIDHAEAMDRILHGWKFPKHLINPIAFHHKPVDEGRKLSRDTADETTILSLADKLASNMLIGHSASFVINDIAPELSALQVGPELISQIIEEVPEDANDMKIAMLSNSSKGNWPPYREQVIAKLPDDCRLGAISLNPQVDPISIFCNRLHGSANDVSPTVAIVSLEHGKDADQLGEKLIELEKQHQSGPIPIICVSSSGKLSLDSEVLDGRSSICMTYPVSIEKLAKFCHAVTPQLKQAA
jgi:HD-like signal output (HDOD) protein/CheY-like chemotaxis protein